MVLIVCDGSGNAKYTVCGSLAQLQLQPVATGLLSVMVADSLAPGGNLKNVQITVAGGVATASAKG